MKETTRMRPFRTYSTPSERKPLMWLRSSHRKSRSTTLARQALTARPQLERLEDRCMLTAGQIDTTFGSGGSVVTSFSSGNDLPGAVIVQPDGKILVGGAAATPATSKDTPQFALARYTTSGSLDTTFGSGGKVTTKFGKGKSSAVGYAMALQSDGKIILGGYGNGNSGLARYKSN